MKGFLLFNKLKMSQEQGAFRNTAYNNNAIRVADYDRLTVCMEHDMFIRSSLVAFNDTLEPLLMAIPWHSSDNTIDTISKTKGFLNLFQVDCIYFRFLLFEYFLS